jgi:hypothetical protein
MSAKLALLLLPAVLPLSGCISYSASPQIVVPTAPACVYAGQPYSIGATVQPPNSAPLQCRPDGSWYPG